jgi:hypothetical protein
MKQADVLRARIATYRRCLEEGPSTEAARIFLVELSKAQEELKRLEAAELLEFKPKTDS